MFYNYRNTQSCFTAQIFDAPSFMIQKMVWECMFLVIKKESLGHAFTANVEPPVKLSFPASLSRKSKRLRVDRVTCNSADTAVSFNEKCFEDVLQIPSDFLPPSNIETTKERESFFQDFSYMFIQLNNQLSKTMCHDLLKCLQRNRDMIPSFIE